VHERITGISRELLMQIKELAESMDFKVLHGIVDCLWVIEPAHSKLQGGRGKGDGGILTE
jgi:DNA polymerase elongation subunit (family B)